MRIFWLKSSLGHLEAEAWVMQRASHSRTAGFLCSRYEQCGPDNSVLWGAVLHIVGC